MIEIILQVFDSGFSETGSIVQDYSCARFIEIAIIIVEDILQE